MVLFPISNFFLEMISSNLLASESTEIIMFKHIYNSQTLKFSFSGKQKFLQMHLALAWLHRLAFQLKMASFNPRFKQTHQKNADMGNQEIVDVIEDC